MEHAGRSDELVEVLWWCCEAEEALEAVVAHRRGSCEAVEAQRVVREATEASAPFHTQVAGVGA